MNKKEQILKALKILTVFLALICGLMALGSQQAEHAYARMNAMLDLFRFPIEVVNALEILSYRVQHLASGDCLTSIEEDGNFELKPCISNDQYQRFAIIWDFETHKFLFWNFGARAYVDVSGESHTGGELKETQF